MDAHIFRPLRDPAFGCMGSNAQLPQTDSPSSSLASTSLILNILTLPSVPPPRSYGLPGVPAFGSDRPIYRVPGFSLDGKQLLG